MDINSYMPIGMAYALFDNETARANFSNMTEAEREALILKAKDSKSEEDLEILLNELSAHGSAV